MKAQTLTYVRDAGVHDEIGVTLHILSPVMVGDGNILAVGYQWNFSTFAISLINPYEVEAEYILDIVIFVIQQLIEALCQILYVKSKVSIASVNCRRQKIGSVS